MDIIIYQDWQRSLPIEADSSGSWESLSSPTNYNVEMIKIFYKFILVSILVSEKQPFSDGKRLLGEFW